MSFEKFFTRPAELQGASLKGPLKHGDFSADKTKRFWAYYHGKEGWVTAERFETAKTKTPKIK